MSPTFDTYLILINALGLLIMLADKYSARRGLWRIPERVLMGIGLAGGSIGIFLGMHLFHHKTRKPLFYVGIPAILVIQSILILQLYK